MLMLTKRLNSMHFHSNIHHLERIAITHLANSFCTNL